MAERFQRQRNDGGGNAGTAARHHRLAKIDTGIRHHLADGGEVLEVAVLGKCGGGQAASARNMARTHAGTRLGLVAGETSRAAGIGNLLFATVNDAAHG